jgi:hypothetical protein
VLRCQRLVLPSQKPRHRLHLASRQAQRLLQLAAQQLAYHSADLFDFVSAPIAISHQTQERTVVAPRER